MARPLRLEFAGALYHVTSRGDGREAIFLAKGDQRLFSDVLAGVWDRFNWPVHAYCLMINHDHLLVETPDANLSKDSSTAPTPSASTGPKFAQVTWPPSLGFCFSPAAAGRVIPVSRGRGEFDVVRVLYSSRPVGALVTQNDDQSTRRKGRRRA